MTIALNNNVTPLPVPLQPGLPGQVISVSCNVLMALSLIEGYLDSTYNLEAADTELQAAISNQEAAAVTSFENWENHGGTLSQLEALDPSSKTYASDVQRLSAKYSADSAGEQAEVKVMDGNSSVAGNTLNQNSQGQSGVITTMGSVNSIAANLVRILQS